MRRVALCFLLFSCMHLMHAQELVFEKPDNLENIPSTEAYKILEDDQGYIWFSTETGLCRYDGQEVKVFRAKEGIPEEICYGLVKDSKGLIYVVTSRNRILRFNGHSFLEIPGSKRFSKVMNDLHMYVNSVKISGDTAMILTNANHCYSVNLKKDYLATHFIYGTVPKIMVGEVYGISLALPVMDTIRIRLAVHGVKRLAHTWKNETWYSLCYGPGYQKQFTVPIESYTIVSHRVLLVQDHKGNKIISGGTKVVTIKKDLTASYVMMDEEVLSLYVDRNNGLWIGARSAGLIYFPDASDLKGTPFHALKGQTVTNIVEDREGNIWCTTLENGVLFCRNKNLQELYENTYEKGRGPFLATHLSDSIYIFTQNGPVLKFLNNRMDTLGVAFNSHYISFVHYLNNNWLIGSKPSLTWQDYYLKRSSRVGKGTLIANQVVQLKNGRLFGCHYTSFYEFTEDKQVDYLIETGATNLGLFTDKLDRLYIYTNEKLFEIDTSDFKITKILALPNMVKVMPDSKNRFWVLTKNSGLYTYANGKIDSMNIRTPASEKANYYDIHEDQKNNIWLATDQGLLKLIPVKDGFRQEWFWKEFGLPDAAFRTVITTSDKIIASTKTGVYCFPFDSKPYSRNSEAPVYIHSIKVNDRYISASGNMLRLDYDENTLQIAYDVLDYNTTTGIPRLAYKVRDYDESVHYLDQTDVLLTKLPPGEFELRVSAVDENNNVISDINTLYITITPPFWQEWPFILLSAVSGFALTIYIVLLVVRRSRRKEEEKNRIDKMLSEYQMSALKAQMNPHFIFNCINSIQRYILTNKTHDAYDYLAKFSKLIRLVLNYSEDVLITLEEELEIAHLYIEMEQIRYEGFFSYEIICDEKVRPDEVYIPSLLLQPYIENAIWHGIMNLNRAREGRIVVRIGLEDTLLKITIEDNGVGREAAARHRNKNHKSKALGLNKKRMELINIMNDSVSAFISIEDILDDEQQVQGTIVKLSIPQINKND